MDERSECVLRRGRVVFEAGRSLTVRWTADGATGEIVLPYPRLGYGGHELVVSRSLGAGSATSSAQQ